MPTTPVGHPRRLFAFYHLANRGQRGGVLRFCPELMKSHAPIRERSVQVFDVSRSFMFQRAEIKWHEEGRIKIMVNNFNLENTL